MHLSASILGVDPWEPLGTPGNPWALFYRSTFTNKPLPSLPKKVTIAPPPEATVGSDGTLGHKVQFFKVYFQTAIKFSSCHPQTCPQGHPPPPTPWVMMTEKCITVTGGITIFIMEKPIRCKKLY